MKFAQKGTAVLMALVLMLGMGNAGTISAAQPENTADALRQMLIRIEKSVLMTMGKSRIAKMNGQLSSMIENYLAEKQIARDEIGIEVESLDGLFHYSLNGDEEFIAASLYKVPLAVVYYDAVNEGETSLEDTLPFYSYMYEEGGPTGRYESGSQIELEELLHNVITYSDNSAGHVLYENLGGWVEYKEAIRYLAPDHTSNPSYLSYENITTPAYMNELMIHIAEHSSEYELLIEDMIESMPERYLNKTEVLGLPQKYGEIAGVENASGFCLDTYPYAVTIMTTTWQGEAYIGDLSSIVHRFFAAVL